MLTGPGGLRIFVFNTIDFGHYYAVLPSACRLQKLYQDAGINISHVPCGFAYNSGNNSEFLTVAQLRELVKQHVDPALHPV